MPPSKEDKYRCEKMAKQKGVPLSKFLIGPIENHINEPSTPREMVGEIDILREEKAKLIEDLNRKWYRAYKKGNRENWLLAYLQIRRTPVFDPLTVNGAAEGKPEATCCLPRNVL